MQFWVLMLGSLCIVGAAAGLYAAYGPHISHFPHTCPCPPVAQFWVLMLGSLCIVGAAAGLYTVYALFKSKPNGRYQQLPTSEHQGGWI